MNHGSVGDLHNHSGGVWCQRDGIIYRPGETSRRLQSPWVEVKKGLDFKDNFIKFMMLTFKNVFKKITQHISLVYLFDVGCLDPEITPDTWENCLLVENAKVYFEVCFAPTGLLILNDLYFWDFRRYMFFVFFCYLSWLMQARRLEESARQSWVRGLPSSRYNDNFG